MINFTDHLDLSVTVCDKHGTIVYMNEKAKATFGNVVGQDVYACHPPHAKEMIKKMLETGASNSYTIEKKGIKKLIYQTPWRDNGEICGLVEFSMVIPFEMPHKVRLG